MWIADGWKEYEVLDTSKGEKLERWGKYILVRPVCRGMGTSPFPRELCRLPSPSSLPVLEKGPCVRRRLDWQRRQSAISSMTA